MKACLRDNVDFAKLLYSRGADPFLDESVSMFFIIRHIRSRTHAYTSTVACTCKPLSHV